MLLIASLLFSIASLAEGEDGPMTPYAEPVTISWAVQASAVQQFIDGETYENNVWSRLIKDKLNIDLEVAFSADTSTDAYNQQMSLLLATGEFLDKHGNGVHHIGFEVGADRDEVIAELAAEGYNTNRTLGIYPGSSWTIVDSEEQLGVNLNIKPRR